MQLTDPVLKRPKLVSNKILEIVAASDASQREYVKDDEDIPSLLDEERVIRAHIAKKPLLTLKGLFLILKPKV